MFASRSLLRWRYDIRPLGPGEIGIAGVEVASIAVTRHVNGAAGVEFVDWAKRGRSGRWQAQRPG